MMAVNAANAIRTDVAKADTALKRFKVVFMTAIFEIVCKWDEEKKGLSEHLFLFLLYVRIEF